MSESVIIKEQQAQSWLRQFSQEFDRDESVQNAASLEDLRSELQEFGADVTGFHTKLAGMLRRAKLARTARSVIAWLSPCWQPQWAGQPVGAGDVPAQTHSFPLDDGCIQVTCIWQPQSGANPTYLDLAWYADTLLDGELWCRFVQPETNAVLAELPLGASREGGHYLTPDVLGFDPVAEQWSLALLIKAAHPS